MLAFAMPGSLTRADVEKIAALANLELNAAELELFARQLADILEYANQLQRVDTTGVPPTASIVRRSPMRRTRTARRVCSRCPGSSRDRRRNTSRSARRGPARRAVGRRNL
jgi:aspartyl/glutamyl-tRNA(Asn/Gln) amidotransferase C subunit